MLIINWIPTNKVQVNLNPDVAISIQGDTFQNVDFKMFAIFVQDMIC